MHGVLGNDVSQDCDTRGVPSARLSMLQLFA
jgi:hypothetical protein